VRRAPRHSMMVIVVALIVGWYLRVAIELWPIEQPVTSLAGLFVCAWLTSWLHRTVNRPKCAQPHLEGMTFTCLRAHQDEPAAGGTDG
jgi:hypothetical protein